MYILFYLVNGYLASMKESFKISIHLGIVFNPIRASILLNFNQDFDSFVNYLIFKYLITLNHLMTSFSLLVKFNLNRKRSKPVLPVDVKLPNSAPSTQGKLQSKYYYSHYLQLFTTRISRWWILSILRNEQIKWLKILNSMPPRPSFSENKKQLFRQARALCVFIYSSQTLVGTYIYLNACALFSFWTDPQSGYTDICM